MSSNEASHHADAFDTRAVRAGRDDLEALGVHALPIDLSTTNPLPDVDALVGILVHHLGTDCPNVIATRPAWSQDNMRKPQEDKNHAAV